MKMTFADAVKSGLKNYSNFKGTATRTEFWYFYLFNVLLNMVTSTIDGLIAPGADLSGTGMAGAGPIYVITNVALVLPNLTIAVRRFHDAGFSGKWFFLWLLPVIVFFTTGGASLSKLAPLSAESTEAEFTAYATALVPTVLVALGVGIFQLVLNLKASKSALEGNKYAVKDETATSASE